LNVILSLPDWMPSFLFVSDPKSMWISILGSCLNSFSPKSSQKESIWRWYLFKIWSKKENILSSSLLLSFSFPPLSGKIKKMRRWMEDEWSNNGPFSSHRVAFLWYCFVLSRLKGEGVQYWKREDDYYGPLMACDVLLI